LTTPISGTLKLDKQDFILARPLLAGKRYMGNARKIPNQVAVKKMADSGGAGSLGINHLISHAVCP